MYQINMLHNTCWFFIKQKNQQNKSSKSDLLVYSLSNGIEVLFDFGDSTGSTLFSSSSFR